MNPGLDPLPDPRVMLDALPVIAWMLTPDGQLVYVNRMGREYFGFDVDLVGDGWYATVDPCEYERAAAKWLGPGSEKGHWDAEFRLRRHDGEFRRALVRARAVRDEAGAVVAWVATTTDVEDERRMGDELRRRALDVGLALAAADDAVNRERTHLAIRLRHTALEPLEAAARRLQREGHAEESALVAESLKALRNTLRLE